MSGVIFGGKRRNQNWSPKQILDFAGYQFNLKEGKVRPTIDHWQVLMQDTKTTLQTNLSGLAADILDRVTHSYRKISPPGSSPYETDRVVLKQLEGSRITIKGDPYPKVTPTSLKVVALGGKCSSRPAITPPQSSSANLYRHIIGEHTARGTWSLPENKLRINFLELNTVFLALKEFQDLCSDKIILVATGNTTVFAYINKDGGIRSGPLCALLWRILMWCSRKQVTLKARHIPGRRNVVADKLS